MTDEKKLPEIKVAWNAEAQDVVLAFEAKEFKTYDFVIALLGMAKDKAEAMKKMAQMAQMNAAIQHQNVQQQLAGHGIGKIIH